MKHLFGRACIGFAVLVASTHQATSQIAQSTFASSADGWTSVANGTAPVIWSTASISQQDMHSGIMGFKAPSKFIGNKSKAYAGKLSLEFMTSAATFAPSTPKVRLSGVTPAGTITLVYSLTAPALPNQFYAHQVTLTESAGWVLSGAGRAPTKAEFQAALAQLTDLRIIGDTSASAIEFMTIRAVRLDATTTPVTQSLKVYILAGQSNMAGCDDIRRLQPIWSDTQSDVMMYWGNASSPTFRPLTSGTSGASCSASAPNAYFGPEISFASGMRAHAPSEQIVIIKYAVGGTDLYAQWTPPTQEYPSGGPLWNGLLATTQNALNQLTAMGYTWELKGFLWMQGESDADKRYRANAYASNLRNLASGVRAFTGQPSLPIVIGRIRNAGQPYAETVRSAQVTVANADPAMYWINTDDLFMLPDRIHYDEASMIELGQRFADIIACLR